MKELLTSSRMNKLLDCPRAHYWGYEVGLKRDGDSQALRFGSAWHRAMEARWNGASYDDALAAAIGDKVIADEYEVATLAGLLHGYYAYYADEPVVNVSSEREFRHAIEGSRTFDAAGKIDGVGTNRNGTSCMVEHKTTGDDISPDSMYWARLRANPQVLQYASAIKQECGEYPSEVMYDVTRKPSIQPKEINDLDGDGKKIVIDHDGNRVFKKDGTPRETGDAERGYSPAVHLETPDEFYNRLAADTQTRPEFYFARREVAILDGDIEEFESNRLELGKMILSFRAAQKRVGVPHRAWPRHLHGRVCSSCEYASFCLQGITPDLAHPPAGFVMGPIHGELSQVTEGK